MTQKAQSTIESLPSLTVQYTVVNAFRITGFSAIQDRSDIEIDLGTAGAKAWLVQDAQALLADADRSQALFHLVVDRVLRGEGQGIDAAKAIDAKVSEYREQRRTRFQNPGVYLVVSIDGEVQSSATDSSRDLGDGLVFAMEIVDKDPLRARAQPAISRALAAVALTAAPDAQGAIPVQDAIVLKLPDGRLLCSPNFKGMRAPVSSGRELTAKDAAAIAQSVTSLGHAPTQRDSGATTRRCDTARSGSIGVLHVRMGGRRDDRRQVHFGL